MSAIVVKKIVTYDILLSAMISYCRLNSKFSLEDVAGILSLEDSVLASVEMGENKIDVSSLNALTSLFKISMVDFFKEVRTTIIALKELDIDIEYTHVNYVVDPNWQFEQLDVTDILELLDEVK